MAKKEGKGKADKTPDEPCDEMPLVDDEIVESDASICKLKCYF